MRHEEFIIGQTFWTATGPHRCTDVGTRTIVAVHMGPRTIVQRESLDHEPGTTVVVDDPGWLNGPPYAAAEMVFDEDDLAGCYRTETDMRARQHD
jgi:hypothetical protein